MPLSASWRDFFSPARSRSGFEASPVGSTTLQACELLRPRPGCLLQRQQASRCGLHTCSTATPANLSGKRGPADRRRCGQTSPLSDRGVRMSGSSLRTLFTRLLTARLSKGPSCGFRTRSSSTGSGARASSHSVSHRGSMIAGCRWWMSSRPGEASVVMMVKVSSGAPPGSQRSHSAANDSGEPSFRVR